MEFLSQLFALLLQKLLELHAFLILKTNEIQNGDLVVIEQEHLLRIQNTFWIEAGAVVPNFFCSHLPLQAANDHNPFIAFLQQYDTADRQQFS